MHWYIAESFNTDMLRLSTDLDTSPLLPVKYSIESPSTVIAVKELLLMIASSIFHVSKSVGQLGRQVMLKLLPSIILLILGSPFTTTVMLGTPRQEM